MIEVSVIYVRICMDEIGFPKNLPDEFKTYFVSAFNEINRLKEEVSALKRIAFSQRSEKFIKYDFISPEGTLFNEAEDILYTENHTAVTNNAAVPAETYNKQNNGDLTKKKKQKNNSLLFEEQSSHKFFPNHIPREVITHDLNENEKICQFDHSPMVKIGEEIVEKLDVVPSSLKVIQHRYLKYACKCCQQNLKQSKAIPSVIHGSFAESGLLAHVVVNKYLFALPLYRQEMLFKQKDILIPRVTLARWMIACANILMPLVSQIKKYILSFPVIHCDETFVQVLKGTDKKPTSKSYMWVLVSHNNAYPASYFQLYPNFSSASANELLNNYSGFLQVDGYDGYNKICEQYNVTRVGCWAHVRRKFDSALKDGAPVGKTLAGSFLSEIQNLFLIESKINSSPPEEKIEIRKIKSSLVIQNIRKLIDDNVHKVLPRSKLGSALGYISHEWPHLLHFMNNGLISLSNNRVENCIRPFAIGRKNWLFSHSVNGAQASAALYSLIATAKDNDLHVEEYLNDLFFQLPSLNNSENPDYTPLLPWNWNK